MRYLDRFDEGRVVRAAFFGMLIGTLGVLGLDFGDLVERKVGLWPEDISATAVTVPVLPAAAGDDVRRNVREVFRPRPEGARAAMMFDLSPDGVLRAKGSIAGGTAARFAAEIDAHGDRIRAVSLDSTGGSLDDAIAMAKLIREKGLATDVADGALCASSCPLLFAGGITRHAGAEARFGLHQFYANGVDTIRPEVALSDAQTTTARISRHLSAMGVDPALWLHALDTPPRSLYHLSAEEMRRYRLVTDGPAVAATQ